MGENYTCWSSGTTAIHSIWLALWITWYSWSYIGEEKNNSGGKTLLLYSILFPWQHIPLIVYWRIKHFCVPFYFHSNTNMQLIKTLLKCNTPVNLNGLISLTPTDSLITEAKEIISKNLYDLLIFVLFTELKKIISKNRNIKIEIFSISMFFVVDFSRFKIYWFIFYLLKPRK